MPAARSHALPRTDPGACSGRRAPPSTGALADPGQRPDGAPTPTAFLLLLPAPLPPFVSAHYQSSYLLEVIFTEFARFTDFSFHATVVYLNIRFSLLHPFVPQLETIFNIDLVTRIAQRFPSVYLRLWTPTADSD